MLKRPALRCLALWVAFGWAVACPVNAQEAATPPAPGQVLAYDSDITVNPDSTLLIRETLRISAARPEVGIYREIATRYLDRFGNPYNIHLEVVSVLLDGQPEGFRLAKVENGLRVYMGNPQAAVPPAEHTYELTYSVDRAIGFFPEHDELYWNVTGTAWTIPLAAVSADLHLPSGIARQAILLDGYTGGVGSVETSFAASADSESNATFRTTRALGPHESLTVVVRWPKGFVHLPSDEQKFRYFLQDHQGTLVGLVGFVVTLIYYAGVWLLLGKATARGDITPRPDPPAGFSPAALRYAWCTEYDQRVLVASIIDLAIKNQLAILEDSSGRYILGRVKPEAFAAPELMPDERLVLAKFFAAGDTIRVDPVGRSRIGGAAEALRHHLFLRFQKISLLANARYLLPGFLIAFATIIRAGLTVQGAPNQAVLLLGPSLLVAGLACCVWVSIAAAEARNALVNAIYMPSARKQALDAIMIGAVLIIAVAVGLTLLGWVTSPGVAAALALLVAANFVAHNLLKTPARSGHRLMDKIECFRIYIASQEEAPRGAPSPSAPTAQRFETLLPYAVALNAETAWGEKFVGGLAQTGWVEREGYSPAWYSGPGWNPLAVSTFAASLGNSISAALFASARK